jgi:hypothetical protein
MTRSCRALPLAVAALLLGTLPAAAQRSSRAVGFQAGYANARLRTEGLDGLSNREGAFVGVYYRARLLSWLTLQPEVDFTIKGGEVPLLGLTSSVRSLSLDLGVLEVPVLLKVAPPYRRERIRPFVFGGASLGLEVGCTRTLVGETQVRSVECSGSETVIFDNDTLLVTPLEVPSPEASWIVGAGIQWEVKDIGIGLEARYQRGLRQVLPIETKVRNEMWVILLALTI